MATKVKTLPRKELATVGSQFIALLGYKPEDEDKPFRLIKSMDDAAVQKKLTAAITEFIAGELKPKKSKKDAATLLQDAPEELLAYIASNDLLPEADDEDEEEEEEEGDEEEGDDDEGEEEGEEDEEEEGDDDEEGEDDDEEGEDDGDEEEGEEGDDDDEEDGEDEDGDEDDEDDDEEEGDDVADVAKKLKQVGGSRSVSDADEKKSAKKSSVDAKAASIAAEQPGRAIIVSANMEAAFTAVMKILAQPNMAVVISTTDIRALKLNDDVESEVLRAPKADTATEAAAPVAKRRKKKGGTQRAAKTEAAPAATATTEVEAPKLTKAQRKEVDAAVATALEKVNGQLTDRAKLFGNAARVAYITEKQIDIKPYLTGPNKGKKLANLGTKKLGNIIRDYTAKRAERVAIKKLA